jgi:hypothetical protein
MGLLEYLFEHRNPGPVGSVDVEPPEPSRSNLVLRGLVAAAASVAWTWFLWSHVTTGSALVLASALSLAYLYVAYWLRPSPDVNNLGLWGTMIDHPFRFSDDVNRMLMFLYVFLWPGRFIAATVIDLIDAL